MRYSAYMLAGAMLLVACGPKEGGQAADSSASVGAKSEGNKSAAARSRAADGPFGLEMGAAVASISGYQAMSKAGYYEVPSPPKAHDEFETVVVKAFNETGVCAIKGIGVTIEGDSLGSTARARTDTIAEALTLKYGEPKKSDVCGGSSVSCESQFWSMSVKDGERVYFYSWKPTVEQSPKIGTVFLGVAADQFAQPYLILEYYSRDEARCKAAEAKASAASL